MAFILSLVAWFATPQSKYAVAFSLLLLTICCVFCLTFLVTSLQFYTGSLRSRRSDTHKALTVPYWIPYLGSTLSMIDQHGLYKSLASKAGSNRPLRLKLGSQSMYIMLGPENVRQIYQRSKELSMARKVKEFMHCNLISREDLAIYDSDRSGDLPRPTQVIAPEKRVFYNTVKVFEKDLTASVPANAIAAKFQEVSLGRLSAFSNEEFFSVGLFKFLQKEMLMASGTALHGEEIFRQNPSWYETFWDYEKGFLMLSLGLPRWLLPGVYRARDTYVASIRQWFKVSYAKDNLQASSTDDAAWEPTWGSRFWRRLIVNFQRAGISLDGAASSSAGIIWALHSNAIPATAWLLFEVLCNRLLFQEIMAELSTVLKSSSPPTFDVKELLALPILNSVYQEILRLRVSLIIYREAIEEICINGAIVPAGARLLTPSWPAHTSEQMWAPLPAFRDAHSGKESLDSNTLPAHRFDPYRFLAMQNIKSHPRATKAQQDRAAAALSQHHFFPWGGGLHMCAGRTFAKQEIFLMAATMLVGFELEAVGWEKHEAGWPEPRPEREAVNPADATAARGRWSAREERAAGPDLAYAGGAVLPPDRDLRVRMRRRKW